MGRPAIVNTEQILAVARELFLEQGIAVTTAAIAKKAGVSEGSIFKRFATKEDLFCAALGIPEPTWLAALPGRVGQGDIAANLMQIVLAIIDFYRDLFPRTIMLWSCRWMAQQPMWKDMAEPPPMRGLKVLVQYLEGEMALGRLRRADPQVVARATLGSAQHFVFFEMTGLSGGLSDKSYADALVDLIYRGLAPQTPFVPL